VKRRKFITLLGGAAATWPLAAHAQQGERLRRVGMLVGFDDPDIKAFQQELEKLGWSEGRNVHIDYLYAPAGAQVQVLAKDLVTLQPDVIFSQSRPATAALQHATNTIPIIFCYVIDPIGAGFVDSYPRPGGNLTGFVVYEPSVMGKWMEMLKETAPQTTRIALLGNPRTAVYYDYLLHAAQAAAPSLGVEPIATRIESDVADIERAIAAIASVPNGSLVVAPDSTTNVNSELIIRLAARYRLPAIVLRCCGRSHVLRGCRGRAVPAGSILRRPHPSRRQAGRSSGTKSYGIRNRPQSQNGQGARHHGAANSARRR
jgi:putative ABC transport system substrate-binding protein